MDNSSRSIGTRTKSRKTTFLILPGLAEITMVSVNAHVRHQHRLFQQSKDAQVSTTIIIIFPGNIIPQIGKLNWHSAHIVYQWVSYVNSTCLFAFVYISHPGYQGAYCFWSGSVPRRRHWDGFTFQTSGKTLEVIPFKPHVIDMFAWENLMFILVTLGQDHAAAKVIRTSTCPRPKIINTSIVTKKLVRHILPVNCLTWNNFVAFCAKFLGILFSKYICGKNNIVHIT